MFTSAKAKQMLMLAGGLLLKECMLGDLGSYFHSKKHLISRHLEDYFSSYLQDCFSSSELRFWAHEDARGGHRNGMYEAIATYLSDASRPTTTDRDGDFNIDCGDIVEMRGGADNSMLKLTIKLGDKVVDSFEGIEFIWKLNAGAKQRSPDSGYQSRSFNLTFPKRYKEIVVDRYLPYIINQYNRSLKLYHSKRNGWESTTLRHHTDFSNVAMDEGKKTALIDDLDQFLASREFYRRIGRAWKRGYLLYGPPGTGKTTLVAAMANYLKFNIYDLELSQVNLNSELRYLLTSTTSRSILVIEDIDCAMDAQCQRDGSKIRSNKNNRRDYDFDYDDCDYDDHQDKITLAVLLNTIDGLGSYQDERIIIFTTNYKDRLDSALLRPGRMDMHIYMSYCDPAGFRILALNYLSLVDHPLFGEIDKLLQKIEITPAEVAEPLIRNRIVVDNALQALIDVLNEKWIEIEKTMIEANNIEEQEKEDEESELENLDEEQEKEDEEREVEKDDERNVQMKRNNTRIVGQQFIIFLIFVSFLLNCSFVCKSFF